MMKQTLKNIGIALLAIAVLICAIYFIGMWLLIFFITGGLITYPLMTNDKK